MTRTKRPHNQARFANESASPRRHKKRKKGPDPLVLGLGVMLLLLTAGGVVLLLTSSGQPGSAGDVAADDPNDEIANRERDVPTEPTSRYTAEQVDTFGEQVDAKYEPILNEGVDGSFIIEVRAIAKLIDEAKFNRLADDYDKAYDRFTQADQRLDALAQSFAEWREKQALLEQLQEQQARVAAARQQAADAGAERWALASWNEAQAAWDKALEQLKSDEVDETAEVLARAQSLFESAIARAGLGQKADQARQTMFKQMAAGPSEQAMRTNAPADLDRFNELRVQGDRQMSAGEYKEAKQSFAGATGALVRAQQEVELARYARFYALEAGFKAASLMLAVAAGDTVEKDQLGGVVEAYDKLALSNNPAGSLQPGEGLDFAAVSEALVFKAREAIGQVRGEAGQASYLAGFHMQVIAQTLQTPELTRAQQTRIHKSLAVIQEQANAARWNTSQINRALDTVRKANRRAKVGDDPEKVRGLWAELMQPLRDRDSATRLLDPSQSPVDADDPDLFKGLGT